MAEIIELDEISSKQLGLSSNGEAYKYFVSYANGTKALPFTTRKKAEDFVRALDSE